MCAVSLSFRYLRVWQIGWLSDHLIASRVQRWLLAWYMPSMEYAGFRGGFLVVGAFLYAGWFLGTLVGGLLLLLHCPMPSLV